MIRSYRLSKIGSISSKWGAWVAPGSRVAIPNIENFRSLSTGSVDSKDNEEKLLQFKREVFTEKRLEYLSSVKKGDEWFPLEWMSPEDRKLVLKWWLEDSIGEEYVDDVFEIFEPEQLEKIVDGCKGTFDGRAVLEVLSRLQEYSIVDPSTDLEAFIQKQIIERERKSHAIKRLGKVLRAQKFRATGISQSPDRISEASISNLVAPEGSDEDNETNVNRNITQSISGGKRNADPLDSSSKITMAEMHTDLFYTEHEAVYAIHKSLDQFRSQDINTIYVLKPDDVFPLGMAGNYKTNQFLWKPEEIGLLIRECHLEIFDKMTKLKPGGRLLISPEDFIRGLGTSISTSLAAIYLKEHSFLTFFIPNTKDIVLGPDTFFPNARDPTFFDRRYAAAKIMATFEKEMKGLKLVKLKNEYSQASNGYSRRDILQAVLDQPDMEDATDDDKQTGWAAWKKRVVDGKSEEKANEETNSSSEIEQKQAFGIGLFGGMIPINDTTSMKSSTSDLSVEGLQKLAQGQMSIDELVFAIDHDADLKSYQKVLGSILAKTPEKSIIYPDLCTAVDKLNNYVSLIDKFSSYEKKVSSKELTEDDLTMYDLLLFALSKSKKNPELLCQVFIDFWAEVEIITEFPVAVVIDGANWFDSPTASDHPFVRRCIHARELSMVNALSRFLDKGPKNGLSILGLSAELDKNLSSTWVNRKSTNSLKATVSRMSSDECIAMVKYLIHLKALPKNRYEKDPQFMIQEAMAMTGKKFQEVHRLISYF